MVGSVIGCVVKCVREAGSSADDHAHRILLYSNILVVLRKLFVSKWILNAVCRLTPNYRERMRSPITELWNIDVSMLSWLEVPWPRHFDGDSNTLSWKGFEGCSSDLLSAVTVDDF